MAFMTGVVIDGEHQGEQIQKLRKQMDKQAKIIWKVEDQNLIQVNEYGQLTRNKIINNTW